MEISHSLSRNEAQPSLAGGAAGVHVLGLLSSGRQILSSSMMGTLVGSHYLLFLVIKACVLI